MMENPTKEKQCTAFLILLQKKEYLNAAHKAAQNGLGGKYVELALEFLFRQYFEAGEFAEAVGIMNQFGIAGYRVGDRVFWDMAEAKGQEWASQSIAGMPEIVWPEHYEKARESCKIANREADECAEFLLKFRRGHYVFAARLARVEQADTKLVGGEWVGKIVAAEYLALGEEGEP